MQFQIRKIESAFVGYTLIVFSPNYHPRVIMYFLLHLFYIIILLQFFICLWEVHPLLKTSWLCFSLVWLGHLARLGTISAPIKLFNNVNNVQQRRQSFLYKNIVHTVSCDKWERHYNAWSHFTTSYRSTKWRD